MSRILVSETPFDVPASWSNLPKKSQLCVLALCRVFDFMQVASFQTICYYQLKSFGPSLPEKTLSWQTGIASSSFTAAQIFTAMLWGRMADAEWSGRKRVLLIGLWGTGLSCLGLAFSRTFIQVVFFRLLAGASNGTVGIIRTMIQENIKERKHQSRAFLLLPASFMVASVIGPVVGSALADPVAAYPSAFGGIGWLTKFPYALPALASAFTMMSIGFVVFLIIEETLEARKTKVDQGTRLFEVLRNIITHRSISRTTYDPISTDEVDMDMEGQKPEDENEEDDETSSQDSETVIPPKLPFRSVFTYNVIMTLLAQAIFDFHMGGFGNLWPLFLSTPRVFTEQHLPFLFNGGLGLEPLSVGSAMAILGLIGIALQILIYPRINGRLGNVQCFRVFSTLFPVAYFIAPFLATISVASPSVFLWLGMTLVLIVHTTGRIFVLPATIVLLNNCAPDPSVLGMVHGIGQTTSALFRTLGPIFSGWLFGVSYQHEMIGIVWWVMSGIAVAGWISSLYVWERPA
ncbi:major facilitator superfamily transporter [Phlyctema vagabunda]|uniref:Major facilitator superfamily transporter n=1 Tax=Phlyctema vagabunda TaxID=108571 RepID=A0ABR4P1J6_9HELO